MYLNIRQFTCTVHYNAVHMYGVSYNLNIRLLWRASYTESEQWRGTVPWTYPVPAHQVCIHTILNVHWYISFSLCQVHSQQDRLCCDSSQIKLPLKTCSVCSLLCVYTGWPWLLLWVMHYCMASINAHPCSHVCNSVHRWQGELILWNNTLSMANSKVF